MAWLGAGCTSNKYNVLEDFSSNAEMKRVLQACELGHNFDATHNTGIMAPSVSTSTVWSNTSISEINAYYQSLSCLDNCPSSNPPTPDFTYQLVEPCTPSEACLPIHPPILLLGCGHLMEVIGTTESFGDLHRVRHA
ncbi:MAG: hypothetical protein U0T36_03325 [Saprospiraceae bacterium]